MKNLILFFLLITNVGISQTIPAYWIELTDKANSPFTLSSPNQYLSERAIERRAKQGISVVSNDLPVSPAYIDSIASVTDVSLVGTSKWFNAVIIRTSDTNSLNEVNSFPFVKGYHLAKMVVNKGEDKFETLIQEKGDIGITNTPHYPYGYGYNQLALHNAYQLQDLGFKGQGIHIAVIDAGFFRADEMPGLSKLFEEDRILSTYDFVDMNTSVYEDHYHGSAVLSIIGGDVDGLYLGSAPSASFHLLRSEDAGTETLLEEFNWIMAAEYADSSGADIINTSLGYTTFDDTLQNHTYEELNGDSTYIARGADIAASKGMLLCTSAGNSGASEWQYISTPADADSVLTVGAVDSTGAWAFFSSKGPASDGDVKPNVAAVGWNTYLLSPWDDAIIRGNGTSFSSPMMAGMAATLWQALPEKSNMEIKSLIEENSSQYNSPDSLLGYGIPNLYNAYNSETNVVYVPVQNNKIEGTYPNPTSATTNVIYSSNADQLITIKLIDEMGRIITEKELMVYLGKNKLTLDLSKNSFKGVLNMVIIDKDDESYSTKIVVI